MKELAHFSHFFSFSLGLIAIYVTLMAYRKQRSNNLLAYLVFLSVVNLIVLVHVFEAFFKVAYSEEKYNQTFREIFWYAIFVLVPVRLYLSSIFIDFSRKVTGKKRNRQFYYISTAIFIAFAVFVMLSIFQAFTAKAEISFALFFIHIVHLIIGISLLYGSISILRNLKNSTQLNKYNARYLFSCIIIYALLYMLLRSVNLLQTTKYEHIQMFGLGFIDLLFNLANIIFIRNLFLTKISKENDSFLNELFSKHNITKREQEIVKFICEGKTNKEIAETLFISPITVRDHISNIFKKTGVKNRTELAVLFNTNSSESTRQH